MSLKQTVSVVIPVYNGIPFVRRCIQSVLRQTYKPFEIIVVNDASTDQTAEVLSDFGTAIKVIENVKNLERSESRNLGMAAAQGDYIAFIDADDLWKRDHLKLLVENTSGGHADIVYSYCRFSNVPYAENLERMERIARSSADQHLQRYMLIIIASMVKRNFVNKHSLKFNSEYRVGEDIHFFCRMIALGAEVKFVKEMSVLVRRHDGNTTSDRVRSCVSVLPALNDLVNWANSNSVDKNLKLLLEKGRNHGLLFYYLYSLKCGGEGAASNPRRKLGRLIFSPLSCVDRVRSILGVCWPYFPLSKSSLLSKCLFGQG